MLRWSSNYDLHNFSNVLIKFFKNIALSFVPCLACPQGLICEHQSVRSGVDDDTCFLPISLFNF
jgi:hypothetical protein